MHPLDVKDNQLPCPHYTENECPDCQSTETFVKGADEYGKSVQCVDCSSIWVVGK